MSEDTKDTTNDLVAQTAQSIQDGNEVIAELKIVRKRNGMVHWQIPPDLILTNYLLRILEIAVHNLVEASLLPRRDDSKIKVVNNPIKDKFIKLFGGK